jgi:Leu/Phe-tRNA-protein transferase
MNQEKYNDGIFIMVINNPNVFWVVIGVVWLSDFKISSGCS